jgi:transposase-like protein
MDVLKENWMKQIEESARSLPFSRATTTRTSAEHSVGELNTMDEENMERQD